MSGRNTGEKKILRYNIFIDIFAGQPYVPSRSCKNWTRNKWGRKSTWETQQGKAGDGTSRGGIQVRTH